MPIFYHAQAWEEYGKEYAVHKELWKGCVLATLGPQPDKGTTARDFSGRRNNGTLTGATHLPTWGNHSYRGQAFRALTFDGTDDCVDVSNIIPLVSSATRGTFSVWVKPINIAAYAELVMFGWTGGNVQILRIGNTAGGTLQYIAYDRGTVMCVLVTNDVVLRNSTWTHVALVQDGTSPVMTVNGTVVPQHFTDGVSKGSWFAGYTIDLGSLGRFLNGAANQGYLNGSQTDARIYSRALALNEISILARHPLAAYEVRLPEYFTFTGAPSSAKYWMWARQQSTQVISGGIT